MVLGVNDDNDLTAEGVPDLADLGLDALSDELHKAVMALNSDRSENPESAGAVAAMWRSIAADEASPNDVAAFAKVVALRISSALLNHKPTSLDRGSLALSAIGLVQRTDENYSAREILRIFLATERLPVLDDDGMPISPSKAPQRMSRRKRMLDHMRSYGLYRGTTDTNAKKRIDRLLKKIETGL